MKLSAFVSRLRVASPLLRTSILGGLLAGVSFALAAAVTAQSVQPQPTAASTPVAAPTVAPSPSPTATPYPSPTATPVPTPGDSPTPIPTATPVTGNSPSFTVVPGLPTQAEIDAYNAARTPQISIALTAATTPGSTPADTSGTNRASARAASSFQPTVKGGVSALITLPPASASRSKTSSTSANGATPTSQPVATVTLAYNSNTSGHLVWVQMLRGGTLTATDGAGHTYDGSHGFWLTLGASGSTTFNYLAPNVGGTYQVLTRFDNVMTTLSFRVPDAAP